MTEPIAPNPRILIVDDMESIHQMFRTILEPCDDAEEVDRLASLMLGAMGSPVPQIEWEVDSAYQGEDGVELVRRAVEAGRPYGLAFVDMRMPPGWDGIETVEAIWNVDPNIQVVICTAYSDFSWEETIARLGVTDRLLMLKKPFEPAEVRQFVTALTKKWALTAKVRSQIRDLEAQVRERTSELEAANSELQTFNAELRTQIERRAAAEAMMQHKAMHDALTGLPNREHLQALLERCLDEQRRSSDPLTHALMFLDLDDFKLVNDSLGHAAGDALLIEIGERLTRCARDVRDRCDLLDATIARIGGDEFVVVLEGVRERRDAADAARCFLDAIGEPTMLNGIEITTSGSVGITIFDRPGPTVDDLLREADTAMYRAKGLGKSQCSLFDEGMHAEMTARMTLENELRRAAQRGEFRLQYQPIVALECGSVRGFEALLRWSSPSRGAMAPGEWIPIAEELGLMVDIGQWVLDQACRQLREWRIRAAGAELLMAINVSQRQILHGDFSRRVESALATYDLDAESLQLEVTESSIMANLQELTPAMQQLKATGVPLCMDDFGTGYSSLGCLHRFPLDVVKIDRAFLAGSDRSRPEAAVNHAIITLAHNLGIRVIAEGVETDGQLAQLQALECDFAQGFIFARPLEAEDAFDLIDNPRRWLRAAA